MDVPHIARVILWGQGSYFLITGIWPLLHIASFQWVTGPKVEQWLVKAVGVLVGVIGLAFVVAALRRRLPAEVWLIAVLSAFGLAVIDIYYVWERWISPLYLADAAVELIFVVLWLVLLPRVRRRPGW